MGRYCGEDYAPRPDAMVDHDFIGTDRLTDAVRHRDDLIQTTRLDWRVIRMPFGYRVDRGAQRAVPPRLDPFPKPDSSTPGATS
jgi:hypothetical protein